MTMALTSRQKMGAAALIMAFSVLVSRFMGLFRDKIISWQFGAGGEADIYFAAFVVPDFLNHLLAGGYVSITLIPLLSRRFEENEEDAWRFFGTVFCWATLAIGLLTAFAWAAAPVLAPLVAPGFDATQCARLSEFLRIVLPAQVFFLRRLLRKFVWTRRNASRFSLLATKTTPRFFQCLRITLKEYVRSAATTMTSSSSLRFIPKITSLNQRSTIQSHSST